MVLFLFSHLALHLLRPTPQDFERLHSWLLHFGPDTIQSQVARLVLAKLNWGVDEEVSVSCPFKSISTRDLMCVPGWLVVHLSSLDILLWLFGMAKSVVDKDICMLLKSDLISFNWF